MMQRASVNPGSRANSRALWQWQNEQAVWHYPTSTTTLGVGLSVRQRMSVSISVSREAFKRHAGRTR